LRIAFTHAFCWPEVRRGAERFIQEMGAALVERGHEVTVLSSGWDATDSELDGVRTVRIKRHREHGWGHEADFGRRVMPRLAAGRFDVVHSMGRRDAVANIRTARLHPRRRTVFTDLGLPLHSFWDDHPIEARFVDRVVAGIDVYSCMSRYALRCLETDYGRTDGVVMPGGVDLAAFAPAERRAEQPTLLFSGALDEPRKGTMTLLEALPRIAEVVPDVRLQLSGPGDPSAFLAAAPPEAVERTEVLGVGDAKTQHERYGRAWATCLPSTGDSFGMALIESLACGTPLMVSTDAAPQELVDAGRTGTLCQAFDVESVADACIRVLGLSRDPATVERCRSFARRYDWREGMAPWAERLYTSRQIPPEHERPFG
jgi:glycosyltransferase involved in cell wall biosynthesis